MGSNKVVLETINVCRICNTNDDDSWYNIEEESIFDHPNVPILEAMTKLIGVDEVFCEDGSTSEICSTCYTRLSDAYDLQCLMRQNAKQQLHVVTIVSSEENEEIIPEYLETADGKCENKNQTSDTEASVDQEIDAISFLLEQKNVQEKAQTIRKKKQQNSKSYDGRQHQCEVCEKRFLRKSNLVDHLRLHANVKPFECEYCGKAFVQAGNFKSHVRIHTKERPYGCHICGKAYNQSSALTVHIRTHTNERNYTCDICNKRFTNASDMKKHRRVHDPSLHVQCLYCPKVFVQLSNLKTHIKKLHPGEKIPADLGKKKTTEKEEDS